MTDGRMPPAQADRIAARLAAAARRVRRRTDRD